MHLLYVDESGSINKEGKPFFICGLIVTPQQSKQLETLLDEKIASLRHNYPLEIHGSEIYNRRDSWRSVNMNKQERIQYMHEIYEIISKNYLDIIFHVEEVCENENKLLGAYSAFFDKYEQYLVQNNITNYSHIILDKSKYNDKIQQLFLKRRKYILDVPFEVDSKYSRAIQAADMVAYLLAIKINKKIWNGKSFDKYFLKKERTNNFIEIVNARKIWDKVLKR